MRRLVCLALFALVFFTSCGGKGDHQVWYGYSDRHGFMIVLDEHVKTIVVAVMPRAVIARYRADLAAAGTESDELGAVGSLFGLPASHYIRGDASSWDNLARVLMEQERLEYTGVRPSLDAMTTLMVRHAGYLSKSGADDTLEPLAGPYTTIEDIRRILRLVEEGEPGIHLYDMGRFLPVGADPAHLRRWVGTWTELVLREAMLE